MRANAQSDFLAAILYGAFGGLTLPFIPVMGRRLGATPLQVSLLVAAPAIVFLLSFWIVNAVRPVPPVRLVMWPALLGRLLFLFMPLVKTPAPYVVLIVLYHAVNSINTLGYAQVMRAVYPDDVRGRIMALVKVGMAAFWVLGSLAGGQLTQLVPFQFSRVRTPDRIESPEHINPAVTWRILRTDAAFRPFLLAFFVYGFGGWLISAAVPILLVDDLHASNFQVGLLGAVTSAVWMLSFYSWGKMIDERTATNTTKVVFAIGTLTPIVYLLSPNAWVVQLAGITDGLTSAGIDLGWLAAVLHYAPPGQVLPYVTLFNTFVGIRAATAPFIAGALIPSIGARWIFAAAAVVQLTGMLLMRRVSAPRPAEDAAPPGSPSTT